MPQRNVAIARRAYETYNREGPYAIFQFLDPEIVWGTPEQGTEGLYHGHEGVRRFLDEFFELFDEAQIDPEEFIDAGERLLVPFRFRAKAKGSGLEIEEHWVHVWTIRGEQAVRLEQYTERAAALESVGLTEEGLRRRHD
jgi:ketosteroid isomerase-like protein